MEQEGDNLIFNGRDRRLAPRLPTELPLTSIEFVKTALEVGLRDARLRLKDIEISPLSSEKGKMMDMRGDVAYLEDNLRELGFIERAEELGAEVQTFLNKQDS